MKDSRSLRLLLIYDCVYPESLGGVEHRNHELATALGNRGHDVTVAGFTTEPRRTGPTTQVISVGKPGRLYTSSGRRSLREAARLALAVSRLDLGRYDVVETANIPYIHLFPLALRCRLQGKPLVVTWYEYWGTYWKRYIGRGRWLLFAAIEWLGARLGTSTMAVSQLTARRLQRRRSDAQVVGIGISVDNIQSAARDAPAVTPLVYAGRLQKEKRLDLLLEAVALLSSTSCKPVLTIIGDGPDRSRLDGITRTLGLSELVVFAGRRPSNPDVWRQMGGARLAIQPSYREGYGLFPLEAMALGLPVVYCESTESAVSELVRDGREGLCTEANPEDLAKAIETLLSNEEEYRRLSANARLRAQEYDWSSVAVRLEGVLTGLAPRDRKEKTT